MQLGKKVVLLSAMVVGTAQARGVTPYLPLNLARDIERDIERVLILGDQAFLTRPIAAATVLKALPAACVREPRTCQRVRRYLNRYMQRLGVTELSIGVHDGDNRPVENAYGRSADSAWSTVSIRVTQTGTPASRRRVTSIARFSSMLAMTRSGFMAMIARQSGFFVPRIRST